MNDKETEVLLKIAEGVPFSLECATCSTDAPDTLEEAIAAGWREIIYNDGPYWNFLGTCPTCEG